MYQMDYGLGAPKAARPLIKLEPKASKPEFGQNATPNPSRSVGFHGSTTKPMSMTSFATNRGSSSSGSKSRHPLSLSRLFDKLRKLSASSTSCLQPPDTPTSASPLFEAEIKHFDGTDHKDSQVDSVTVLEALDDNSIVEELREPQSDHVIQTHSRRSSFTLIQPPYTPPDSVSSHTAESYYPPRRPHHRDARRPKTAPSRCSLPHPFFHEAPSIPTFRSLSRDESSLGETRQSLEFQRNDIMTEVKDDPEFMVAATARPESPFLPVQSYFAAAVGANRMPAPSLVASRRKMRQRWSGEWNVHDMQDVIQRLRELK